FRPDRPHRRRSFAAVLGLLLGCALLHGIGGLRIARLELVEDLAGIGGLAQGGQRHSELQQGIRRLATLRIVLERRREGLRGVLVVLAYIVGLAEPVAGVAGQRVIRILVDECAEGLLRLGILGLPHEIEGVLILLVGVATG